ncbi:alpha-galactosidase [Rodentibacter caecimuris]|uniref:Alpha-galactosidase n=1 Tax=Rodentibacter caecimuris TaxID=1796644 RepID=A0AAJ3MZA3_9PAST|nr:alpha-galactosidase [Rodentibacter heylii]AOF54182.1 Alpha-galactosidase [Pasteurellaceae bacterium NI1060]OOF72061.1 alpha-galactosidase [Rodentibacter heylii]OOF73632.1 alpha-galactosidase [Rodentibacter heylii]OOF74205.1 alpha-galactosidase [Rodentibacter heylii]
MSSQLVRLQSKETDLILRTEPAEILYFGKHLELDEITEADVMSIERGVANGSLDVDTPITLAAENGRGYFGVSSVEGHRNGYDWAPVFITKNIAKTDRTLVLEMEDNIAKLAFKAEIECDENGVFKFRHTLTNLGEGEFTVNRLTVTLPVPEYADEVLSFYGRWCRELHENRVSLKHGAFVQENRHGRTSHEYAPNLILGTPHFSQQQGKVWGFHLAWSGNHRIRADVLIDGRRFAQLENLYLPGEIQLQQGESHSTPWVYSVYSEEGLNGMSRQFHNHVRQHILHFAHPVRPVHLNIWEGVMFNHHPKHIIAMAEKAAEMGVERFIIDDGWFIGRNDDFGGLGDWYLDEEKYPNGLNEVINAVKKLGMQFGIWVELEMINKPTKLYQTHPDWLLQLEGYDQPEERHQYVLDLTKQEVFDYLLARMDWLLGSHAIDYIKWDHNRRLVQPGSRGRAAVVEQTQAAYRLFDELQKRYPHVEIESCSSGGARIDYEILKRSQRFWASDNIDAYTRQQIHRGMSYFYPPEVMGAHIGGSPCQTTHRCFSIDYRGLTALFGHMGVELDPVKESEEECIGFAKYIALHKQLRPLLHGGEVFRLDYHDDKTLLHGVVAKDKSQAVVLVSQLDMPDYKQMGKLRLPYLQANGNYQVSVLSVPNYIREGKAGHLMKIFPQWLRDCFDGKIVSIRGEWLANAGLTIPVLDPQSAMLLEFKKL